MSKVISNLTLLLYNCIARGEELEYNIFLLITLVRTTDGLYNYSCIILGFKDKSYS